MGKFELRQFSNDRDLAKTAAAAWLKEINAAGQAGARYCVALSGGRITKTFFAEVVLQSAMVSFKHVHFFWADERCVSPDDSESNFRMARELLFEPLRISGPQIHRVFGELPPAEAAAKAETEMRRVVTVSANNQPALDLVLLGMGEDGHVASLFPGDVPARMIGNTCFEAVTDSPKPPPNRVTLTYSCIASARSVWVLVSGAGKEGALRESLREGGETPLARVLASRSDSVVLNDIVL